MKQWYETLFENYAKSYDSECFVQGTIGEADFIEKEINFDKSKHILDIGCGTGFRDIGIFGCRLGAFSRNDKLTKDDFEILVVAQK